MVLDYLDPYHTTRPPEPASNRRDAPVEETDEQRAEDDRPNEPVDPPERNGYDETGESVDEYA
ncbi:MAG: hypothetical protein PF508_19555 [Spirochaeta sp.]|jgi:hypothetical protein|nr:hypothetical protein [Spirochaeta sp.]